MSTDELNVIEEEMEITTKTADDAVREYLETEASTIMANCTIKLFMVGDDEESEEKVSALCDVLNQDQ